MRNISGMWSNAIQYVNTCHTVTYKYVDQHSSMSCLHMHTSCKHNVCTNIKFPTNGKSWHWLYQYVKGCVCSNSQTRHHQCETCRNANMKVFGQWRQLFLLISKNRCPLFIPLFVHVQSILVYPNNLVPIKMCSDCETCGLLNHCK